MMKKLFFLFLLFTALCAQARPGLLEGLGLSSEDTPPDVDDAFVFSAEVIDPVTLVAQWNIADGNYLYRDKMRFELVAKDGVQLLPFTLPEGETKKDEIFGVSEVYHHDTQVLLPLDRDNQPHNISLRVHYQGCSATFKVCYPPIEKTVQLHLPAIEAVSSTSKPSRSTPISTDSLSKQDSIAKHLAEDNLLQTMLTFFGLGLLLAFTPCVFPMIPILSSLIVGEGEHVTTRRAFTLSFIYVLAMSLTYTLAGVLTGLLGENLQAMLQNPWVIGSFSALFVILALSMFDLYHLQLPQGLQQRLHQFSHQQRGGTLVGAGLMGLLSGLIVGPCLAPPLAGTLIFISQHADPVLGGLALFALSMGMGVPLLIIGTSAGSLLPRAGDWMNSIKAIFGVLMLGLAIWMLERIIAGWIALLLWGALLIISAVYLGALNSLEAAASGWKKLWKGVGLILLIYGGLLIIGGSSGSQNIWQPLQTLTSTTAQKPAAGLQFTRIKELTELQQQLQQTKQPVMLDFYADWCVDCKIMEASTFKDPKVITALAGSKLLQIDLTSNSDAQQAILKALQVFGPPTLLFFDAAGKEYRQHRLVGKVSTTEMLAHLASLPKSAL